jgi:hypothetical protein
MPSIVPSISNSFSANLLHEIAMARKASAKTIFFILNVLLKFLLQNYIKKRILASILGNIYHFPELVFLSNSAVF